MTLRKALIRLAHSEESLRPVLLPLLASSPTKRQVGHALKLLKELRDYDYDTFTTFGLQAMKRKQLESMSGREISNLIDQIQDELHVLNSQQGF